MALRINDAQMMITKPTELTADRARDQKLSGYNVEAVRQTEREAEADRHRIQTTEDTDRVRVRPDTEERGREEPKAKREEEAPPPESEDDLRRRAAERFLNLPVQDRRSLGETHSLDISV